MKKFLSDKIALGTVQFGLDYGIDNLTGKIPKKEVFQILKYSRRKGILFLDTACSYGTSEKVIGEYIKDNPDSFKIISKLSFKKAKNIETVFNNTLKKLNLKKIYGYLIHDFSSFLKNPEIWQFIKNLKKEKKVQKIGFSLYFPEELKYLFKNKITFDLIQVPYSIFDQRFSGFFQQLKKKNVEIHIRSVFLQGLVFKEINTLPKRFLKIKRKLKMLEKLAGDLAVPASSFYLNFAVLNPFIDKVVIGVDNIANLKENLNNLKYQGKAKKVYNKLLKLKEEDENIILPVNWKK